MKPPMETGMLLESVFKNSNKNTVYINKKDSENTHGNATLSGEKGVAFSA